MTRIGELLQRLPELRALDERLRDPDWHPTEQEIAEARAALAKSRAKRQEELPLRAA